MTQDSFRGALLGLAAGDALGATVEFRAPGTFAPLTGIAGGGPFHLKPGQWTDDTSMAMCLAESLVECRGFDEFDQMRRYVRWYREGYWSARKHCFDIGGATREALELFERTGRPFAGSEDRLAAGNGSLMRLAPVALAYAADAARAEQQAAAASRTTHAALECIDACRYFARLLVLAVHGAPRAQLLSFDASAMRLTPAIDEIARGSFLRREPPEIIGSGYVVKSLEAALWAFAKSRSFREGALLAANLGDDADTTAAIFGQIAGAHYGENGIPAEWIALLHRADAIRNLADRLFELSKGIYSPVDE